MDSKKITVTHKTYWGPSQFLNVPAVTVQLEGFQTIDAARLVDLQHRLEAFLTKAYALSPAPADARDPHVKAATLVSHATLALLNFVRGDLEKSAVYADKNRVVCALEYHDPDFTIKTFRAVLAFFLGMRSVRDFQKDVAQIFMLGRRLHPDYQAHFLITAAKARGLSYMPLGKRKWLYGSGAFGKVFFESALVKDLDRHPHFTKPAGKTLFAELDVAHPISLSVDSKEALPDAVSEIGFPCVVKPLNENGGKGVSANLQTMEEVLRAHDEALIASRAKDKTVLLERFLPGADHRLMFIDGRYYGCVRRKPAEVTGDGRHTIEELIAELNKARTINLYQSKFLRRIDIDRELEDTLSLKSLSLQSVLPEGQIVPLRRKANLSAGGAADIISDVHPTVIKQAQRVFDHIGIASMGLDYVTTDISQPPDVTGGGFIELNNVPGLVVFRLSGVTEREMGALVLGTDIGDIDTTLKVLAPGSVAWPQKAKPGEALICYPSCQLIGAEGLIATFREERPYQALPSIYKNPSLQAATFYIAADFIQQSGLPPVGIKRAYVPDPLMNRAMKVALEKLGCEIVVTDRDQA